MTVFSQDIFFPLIATIIDEYLLEHENIDRDQINNILNIKHQHLIADIKNNTKKKFNPVDWFSAALSEQNKTRNKAIQPWRNKYTLSNKKMPKGRVIKVYSLAINNFQDEFFPENIPYKEGSLKQIMINAYERNSLAREKCIEKLGYSCQCCGFNFEKNYGDLGKGFIHVHHIIPLSQIKDEYQLNPETDLVPVCANCHAMIHRKTPPYDLKEIKKMLNFQFNI